MGQEELQKGKGPNPNQFSGEGLKREQEIAARCLWGQGSNIDASIAPNGAFK